MARYIPGVIPPWLGTRGGLCIYRMYGRYYARKASSLTGKRVKKDPRFKKTMANARRLGRASGVAALLYRELPDTRRKHGMMSRLTGRVLCLLKKGLTEEAVLRRELKRIVRKTLIKETQTVKGYKALHIPGTAMADNDSRLFVDRWGRLKKVTPAIAGSLFVPQ